MQEEYTVQDVRGMYRNSGGKCKNRKNTEYWNAEKIIPNIGGIYRNIGGILKEYIKIHEK